MYRCVFIDGKWLLGSGEDWTVLNPATEQPIASLKLAGVNDATAAVGAASAAFPAWRKVPASVRAEFLIQIAERVEAHRANLISVQMQNSGKPRFEAEIDVDAVAGTFRYYAGLADNIAVEEDVTSGLSVPGFQGIIRRDPVGVAALIVPWNFPMVTTAWKLAPALAAGCTVVVKGSEYAPLAEIELLRIIEEVELPPGVVNLIIGAGDVVGPPLTDDPRVRKISFTGSDRVGKHLLKNASNTIKNVSLELGGKSPIIVFDDADLDAAVELTVVGAFYNAGQMCSATSRLLISSAVQPPFIERLVQRIKSIRTGSPFDQETEMGPLISRSQYERVACLVDSAIAAGIKPITGGGRVEGVGASGYYYAPTLFEVSDTKAAIWTKEVFGPVLCFTSFDTDDQALELANDSIYGLAATIVTSSNERVSRFTEELEAGYITVNAPQIVSPNMSWGGYKGSSLGRELGPFGLAAFQEIKSLVLPG